MQKNRIPVVTFYGTRMARWSLNAMPCTKNATTGILPVSPSQHLCQEKILDIGADLVYYTDCCKAKLLYGWCFIWKR